MSKKDFRVHGIGEYLKLKIEQYSIESFGNINFSRAIKKILVEFFSEKSVTAAKAIPSENEPISAATQRIELRLNADTLQAIKGAANELDISPNQYITNLLYNHTNGSMPLAGKEIEVLRQSNFQLAMIGRNVNQIARHLNSGDFDNVSKEQLEALHEIINGHCGRVSALLNESGAKYGGKS